MCGIVAGYSKKGKRVGKALSKRYEDQKHRGQEGFGFVGLGLNDLEYFRCEDEQSFKKALKATNSPFIVAHHRFPTSTINVAECAHPILVTNDELDHDYFFVHNGHISNCDELKAQHESKGYVYTTELEGEERTVYKNKKNGNEYFVSGKKKTEYNDSESLAIELARYFDGMTREINTVGNVAFIGIQVSKETGKETKMFYGRNAGSPLHYEENNEFIWLKSKGNKEIPEHVIFTVDLATMVETSKNQNVGYRSYTDRYPAPVKNTQTYLPPEKKEEDENVGGYIYKDGKRGYVDRWGRWQIEEDEDFMLKNPPIYEKDSEGNYKSKMGFTLPFRVDLQEVEENEEDKDLFDIALQNPLVIKIANKVIVEQDKITTNQYLLEECENKIEASIEYNRRVNTYADLMESDELYSDLKTIQEEISESESWVESGCTAFYNIDKGHNGIDFFKMIEHYREKMDDEQLEKMIEVTSKNKDDITF